MKILAFDTATEYCTSALWLDGDAEEQTVRAGQTHSALLLPHCRQLLAGAGLRLADLDAVAFGRGPGSFTGVRIASAAAQGLALGAGLPVIGISTLLALTRDEDGDRVLTALDARMGEIYCAAWVREAGCYQTLIAPVVGDPARLPVPAGDGWVGCGSGFGVSDGALASRFGDGLRAIDGGRVPSAARIAILAEAALRDGAQPAADASLPIYVRDRVARKISERQHAADDRS